MSAAVWPASVWLFAALAALLLSIGATALSIGYAHRRRLIDHPGARRSHDTPTPRGGGIGIVVAAVACAIAPSFFDRESVVATGGLLAAVVFVAAVGWIDDHRGLAARWRFLAHCLAAALFLLPILALLAVAPELVTRLFGVSPAWGWIGAAAAVLAIVWFVNLHNFMDGIDGLLAAQAIFVFAALAALLWLRGPWDPHTGHLVVFAAATLGFLPFNFPRARIFMGDVGSGALGLLIAAGVVWQLGTPSTTLASGLILCSAFVVDATATLVSRMLRGKRWYHAHREHLYQWLARSGGSHARVVALYAGWNLLVAAPVVAWINLGPIPPMPTGSEALDATSSGAGAAVAVYAAGLAAWVLGKRHCLARARRSRHAA